MSSTPVFHAIGRFFEWTFTAFEYLQNYFNDALVVLGFVGIAYWMYRQNKYTKEAAANNTHH
jgi:hypothetical protein